MDISLESLNMKCSKWFITEWSLTVYHDKSWQVNLIHNYWNTKSVGSATCSFFARSALRRFYWHQTGLCGFVFFYILLWKAFLHLTWKWLKERFHIVVGLCRSLKVKHSLTFRKLLSIFFPDHPLLLHITLISHQYLDNFVIAEPICLSHPVLDVRKAFGVGEIEDKHDTLSSLVVGRNDGLEFFLSSGIPHL